MPVESLLRPTAAAQQAAARLAQIGGREQHQIALVLGSGWSKVVDTLADSGSARSTALAELPGFIAPSAAGHRGTATSCTVGGTPVLAFAGRTHLYEGLGTAPVVHPEQVAAAAGCHTVVLTNAAGGLREGMTVGELVLISDHLNLTGCSPLTGAQFLNLVGAYSSQLRGIAAEAMQGALGYCPLEGVYAAMPGPQYETPAEIRMLRTLGADLVGMSTVPEVITARALGLEVLGLSLVTNLAAGITGDPLNHAEVLATGAAGAERLARALRAVLPELARAARHL